MRSGWWSKLADDSSGHEAVTASHHPEKPGTVTIAGRMSKDLSPGTWGSMLKQAGLEKGDLP